MVRANSDISLRANFVAPSRLGIFIPWVMMGIVAIGSVACLTFSSRYDLTAGDRGTAPRVLSTEFTQSDGKEFVLMIAVHPKCACFPATLTELDEISSELHGLKVRKIMLIYKPSQLLADEWDLSAITKRAKQADFEVTEDVEGKLAQKHGMLTSGHIVCYDKSGTLRFSGGVTMTRGHIGWNENAQKLLSILNESGKVASQSGAQIETPVYGCPINKE